MAIIQVPSIAAVVEDQTPQLGGNLDTNGSSILVASGDTVRPATDGVANLATTDQRWGDGFFHQVTIGNGSDAVLVGTDDNELQLRAGTAAQAFQVYNTWTDQNNYERIEVKWDANVATIATAKAGTGSNANLVIGGSNYATVSNLFFNDSNGNGALRYGTTEIVSFGSTFVSVGRNFYPGSDSLRTNGTDTRRWLNTYTDTITIGNGVDAILTADAADTLALRNSTTAQAFNVYNTYTDASNYERLEVKWDTNEAVISTASAGTGTNRDLKLLHGAGDYGVTVKSNSVAVYAGSPTQVFDVFGTSVRFFQTPRPATDGGTSSGSSSNRWSNTYTDSITIGDGVDAILTADAADELALRNGTNAQQFNVYSTYTDASNYERLRLVANNGSNVTEINTDSAGTGTTRTLRMRQAGGSYWTDWESAGIKFYGAAGLNVNIGSASTAFYKNINPDSDGSVSSGTSSLRWANTYTDSITIGNGVDAILTADAADTLALRNSTTAQQFNVYNTYTDASNYERLQFRTTATGSYIETTSAGTGADRALYISNGSGTNRGLVIGSAVQSYTDFHPQSDSVSDLGITTKRWATTYTDGIATDVETFTAASDTLDALNNVALCDCTSNNITINLPAASTASGLQYHIKKIDSSSNTVTVDGNGSETIDGATTQVISSQYDSMTIVSDGSNWFII